MPTIELRLGGSSIPFDYEPSRFEVLLPPATNAPLGDPEIGAALEHPVGSEPLEEIIDPGETVLLVLPDATRQSGCAQIVNLVVRRLIANGSAPSDINIIFATGIHRPVTEDEKQHLLTPFIAQRIKTLRHDANDPIRNFRVGETSTGVPVELYWVLTEFDHVVLIGSVTFHYFAGFTGGRKLICPGLASARTIEETHKLAFDCETKGRREGVGTTRLDGNPVNEAFEEAAAFIRTSFSIMTVVNDTGEITEVFCGDRVSSHRLACESYLDSHRLNIDEKRDLVIASCGGYPMDINMIQAHKTLEAASQACNDGGTIILLAECADGLGRSDFIDWFESRTSAELAERLCSNYQVNGQTAWSLKRKTERFRVEIVTSLTDQEAELMGMKKISELSQVNMRAGLDTTGYILPFGSKLFLEVTDVNADGRS
jgi:nickel-dependent lactate racemase